MNVRRLLTGAVLACGLLVSGAAVAQAQTEPTTGYAAQAAQAGLDSAQTAYLQSKIAGLVSADHNVRQVSVNTIEVGGHLMAIGAPGQSSVQAVGVANPADAAACPNLYLCGYHNGVTFKYTDCTTHYLSGWTGAGYIFNNQTTGTVSYLYKLHNAVYVKDVAKDFANREVNWDPVWSIRVC